REWADVFVINKADLSNSRQMRNYLLENGITENRIFETSVKDKSGFAELYEGVQRTLLGVDWTTRRAILHEEMARSLFFERKQAELEKEFNRRKSALLKAPYGRKS